ncbi:MAG: acyl-CoA thioesterase [Alphaproteobacteria bacterium]
MPFHRYDVTIRFSHCDPAGIVYFPRFFSLFNDTVEDWFTRGLGIDYADLLLVQRLGLPIAHVACDFSAPCFMGECLSIDLTVERIGTSSLTLRYCGHVEGERRLSARSVQVHTSLATHRPIPIGDDWRGRMQPFMMGETEPC